MRATTAHRGAAGAPGPRGAADAVAMAGGPPRTVAVFRALMLGDLLCATPALRALRAAWPQARITLIGLPWAGELAGRLASIDDFEPFPGWPGLPEVPPPSPAETRGFLQRMRSRRFDLAIQLHGSGQLVNGLVAGFGAAGNAGFGRVESWFPPADARRFLSWPERGSEVLRLLALTDHLGLPRRGLELDLPLKADDQSKAAALAPSGRPYAIVHAGSQLPSRRWPPQRFSAVADQLAQAGLAVMLTGTAGERELVAQVAAAMRHRALDLCGATDLWTLGALLAGARVLVCNDTGLSHMAAALGTPSAVVASGSDAIRWAPLDEARHQVFWHDIGCRPCAHRDCPIGHPCAMAVPAEPVAAAALRLARTESRACAWRLSG